MGHNGSAHVSLVVNGVQNSAINFLQVISQDPVAWGNGYTSGPAGVKAIVKNLVVSKLNSSTADGLSKIRS